MDSWRLTRRAVPTVVAVALISAVLASPAVAAGTRVDASEPGKAAAPAPASTPASLKRTTVPEVGASHADPGTDEVVAELPKTGTDGFRMIGVTWAAGGLSYGVSVQVRTRSDGIWSDWTTLDVEDEDEGGVPGTEPLWVGRADGVAARVTSRLGAPQDVRISTIDTPDVKIAGAAATAAYDPGDGVIDGVVRAAATAVDDGSPSYTPPPPVITRAQWGAAPGGTCDAPTVGSTTRGIVIHHTAGTNSYAKSESAAIVKATQAYHIGSRKWCDIGYNFLVDKYGQIFEGRKGGMDRNVRAAHSGNGAVNTYTMGVSMMGNLSEVWPSAEMQASMVKLIGWRMGTTFMKAKGTYQIDGLTLNMIAGHRNVVGTECPGTYGYQWLSQAVYGLRDRVEAYIANYSTPIKTLAAQIGSATLGPVMIGENPTTTGRRIWYGDKGIYWSPATGAHLVSGEVMAEYARLKVDHGGLGFPTGDYGTATSTTGGQRFQGGAIFRIVQSGGAVKAFGLWDAIAGLYRSYGETGGVLGVPTSSIYVEKTGVHRANFAHGFIRYTVSTNKAIAYDPSGRPLVPSDTGSVPPAIPGDLSVVPSSDSAVVSWSAAAGAKSYYVCLQTDPASASCTKGVSTTATSVTFTGLTARDGTDYYVRVGAYNDAGSSRTELKTFDLPPAIPGGLSVVPSSDSAVVSWSAAAGAKSYYVCLQTDPASASCTKGVATSATSVTFTGLTARDGTDYYVRVGAYNDGGSSRTELKSFDLTAPANPAVAGDLSVVPSSSSAVVSWSAAAGANSYYVCLQTDPASASCTEGVATSATSVTFTGLTARDGIDYYVRVGAYNDAGSSRTELKGFDLAGPSSVPAIPTGLAVSSTSSSAVLSWSPAARADRYYVCLQTSHTATTCYKGVSTTATSVTFTGLAPTGGTDYFFRVGAYNAAGSSRSELKGFDLGTSSSSADVLNVPSSGKFTLTGHGYGHGIGMSQYGAQGAALQGKGADQILSYYYPGTALARTSGSIRVLLSKDTTSSVVVKAIPNLKLRLFDLDKVITLPTSASAGSIIQWRIMPLSGQPAKSVLQFRTSSEWRQWGETIWTGDGQFEAPILRLYLPDGSGVDYRDALRSAAPSSGSSDRNTVNVVSLENYVRGVVAAEMPSSWKKEALKAQAVAARTYGVRSRTASRYYDICDTTSCQVYRGVAGETAATNAAVAETADRILTYDGKPAFTQFSSSSGGWTAVGSQPYLVAKQDIYDDFPGNGVHDWTFTANASTLESKHKSLGTLKTIKITKREGGGDWGGRVTTVVLIGSKDTVTISGPTMRFDLGLRSAWFRL